jgi:DNA ligase D-like protein (predicted ligase)
MGGPDRQPDWLDPELATLTRERFSDPAWIYERKLDGERCLTFRDSADLRLETRNRKVVSSTYPELADALAGQPATDFIVDGEVVAFEDGQTKFSQLQQRLGVARPGPDLLRKVPVTYYIFDVLWADGTDLRPLPLLERKQHLRDLLRWGGPLTFVEHRVRDGEEYYAEACRQGWEGLIAKRADAPYRAGRTKDWLKFKCENNQEFVIGGFTDPQGTRIGFGALLIGYYDGDELVYAGKVGTGFTTATLRVLHEELARLEQAKPPFSRGELPRPHGVHWTKPELVGQVGFSEWTTAGELRHPRFQGLRRDKSAKEVIKEVPQDDG